MAELSMNFNFTAENSIKSGARAGGSSKERFQAKRKVIVWIQVVPWRQHFS
jgi:hypothetical protein